MKVCPAMNGQKQVTSYRISVGAKKIKALGFEGKELRCIVDTARKQLIFELKEGV